MSNINPIQDGRTAPVDNNGVLNCLVQQPVDNTPSEVRTGTSTSTLKYVEKFKGPYNKLKDILSHIKIGQTISEAHSDMQSHVGRLISYFSVPDCPNRVDDSVEPPVTYGGVWRVVGVQIDEHTAGDHAFIRIEYEGIYNKTTDSSQDVWSLQWQSYSVDPYAFCKNDESQPYACSPSFDDSSFAQNAVPPDEVYWGNGANRANIDKYLNSLHETKIVNGTEYAYYTPNQAQLDVRYFLNGGEQMIMRKKMLGRSATWHYPILTHQTVQTIDLSAATLDDTVGDNIDHIVDYSELTADGCPYNFPKKNDKDVWIWVKTGDEMSETKDITNKKITFTRRETFSGFTDVDRNFYGNEPFSHDKDGILSGRWELNSI